VPFLNICSTYNITLNHSVLRKEWFC